MKIKIEDFVSAESVVVSLRACESYAMSLFEYNKEKDLKPNTSLDVFRKEGEEDDLNAASEQFDAIESVLEKYNNSEEIINKTVNELKKLGIDRLLCFIYMERMYFSKKDNSIIPKYKRYTFNPKLFIYFNDRTTLNMGINSTVEDRIGGDIKSIEDGGDSTHSYFEKNKTNRLSTQIGFDHKINEKSKFRHKNFN
jgi:hypothetical protein